MATGRFAKSFDLGGVSIANSAQQSITFDILKLLDNNITLPTGKVVTDWVKTDADTAACNLPGGHGYTTGLFDVYFPAGVRYAVPGTVTTNALALDGGDGTDFPASATAGVIVTRCVNVPFPLDGDKVQLLGVIARAADLESTAIGHIKFCDTGDAEVAEMDLEANGMNNVYDIANGTANPVTGNPITYALATSGSATESLTLQIAAGLNLTE
jgi:hypothetical protein